jgi:hypothetical protein
MSENSLEQSLQHSLQQSLATTNFDPENLELADVFPNPWLGPTVDAEAPAVISVGLNPVDLAYVYLAIDPVGEAVLARQGEGFRFPSAVWLDLRPAEALELGRRLQVCGKAAAQFAEAFPEEPDEADGDHDRLATNLGTNSDTGHVPPDQAT